MRIVPGTDLPNFKWHRSFRSVWGIGGLGFFVGTTSLLLFVEANLGIADAITTGNFRSAKIMGGTGWLFHLSWMSLAAIALICEMDFGRNRARSFLFLGLLVFIFTLFSILGGRLKASYFILLPFLVWAVQNASHLSLKRVIISAAGLLLFLYVHAWAIAEYRASFVLVQVGGGPAAGVVPEGGGQAPTTVLKVESDGGGILDYISTLIFVELNKLLVLASTIELGEQGALKGNTLYYLVFPLSLILSFDGQIPGNYISRLILPGDYGFWAGLPGDLYLNMGLWGVFLCFMIGAVIGLSRYILLFRLKSPSLWVVLMCAVSVLLAFGLNRWPEWVMIGSYLVALRFLVFVITKVEPR